MDARTKTVLIVEDNELNMKLFHDLLDAHGYTPRFAPTAELALLDGHCETADCLLVDVALPGLSGLGLVAQLEARIPGIVRRVIVMSARDSLEWQAAAQALGARAFLRKPFPGQVLIELIEQIGASVPAPALAAVAQPAP